jgi:hypothetical protein
MSHNLVVTAAATAALVASTITPTMAGGGQHGGGHFYGPRYLVCTACPKLHVFNPPIVSPGPGSGGGGGSGPPANPRQPQKK